MRFGEFGIEIERLAALGFGRLKIARFAKRDAQVRPRHQGFGMNADGGPVTVRRLTGVAAAKQDIPEVGVGL